jgi:hypothetical protein
MNADKRLFKAAKMEISETILNEWKRQAAADKLLEEYEHHRCVIYPPLPYLVWKRKFAQLNAIQEAPGYMDTPGNIARETRLCNELGY